MANLSPLFNSTVSDSSLLSRSTLSSTDRAVMEAARQLVRACLRDGLTHLVRPRFFTQGSWSYKTLNGPAHCPPQQADLDDGAYLPISFVSRTGRPSQASSAFFSAAEFALAPLARQHGWQLVNKPTCIRVVISRSAHIDIPLYAIPDDQFRTLEEARVRMDKAASFGGEPDHDQDIWEALPPNCVLLAHREDDWISSDPRPLRDWFLGEVERKGEQLRRCIRYLKAFRDWNWIEGGPCSILLMAAAAPLFKAAHGRDDLALLEVVKALPDALRRGVRNPTDRSELLTDALGASGVSDAANKFSGFAITLGGAIAAADAARACAAMVGSFGPRFPNEPWRVQQNPATASPAGAFGTAVTPAGGYTFPNANAAPVKPRGFA